MQLLGRMLTNRSTLKLLDSLRHFIKQVVCSFKNLCCIEHQVCEKQLTTNKRTIYFPRHPNNKEETTLYPLFFFMVKVGMGGFEMEERDGEGD